MATYTFAELLTCFFHLYQDLENRKTQEDLAQILQVNRRTINNWFSGNYAPRTPEPIMLLAKALCLTTFQADLLFYSVNPQWVKYGTPAVLLESAEVMRYREEEIKQAGNLSAPMPSLAQIERQWSVSFRDKFASNHQRWGVGVKQNGICQIERKLHNGNYELTLQNQYHEDVFMGGDSNCFAPKNYYLTVQARMTQGNTSDDGYGLLFEAINDEYYALLRVREQARQISVVQTLNGGDHAKVYLRRKPAPALRPQATNKLAILAIQQEHWFYVNDSLVGQISLPRLAYSRLDVGIIAGSQQKVVCQFQDFRVYVPKVTRL